MKHRISSPLIIGNWKMNGLPLVATQLAQALVAGVKQLKPSVCEVVVCPPAPLLHPVAEALAGSGILLGGQDCHYETHGAYTGDVSPIMLQALQCRYVILGHSERRCYHLEKNQLIRQKAESAINAGLIAVICIGESEQQRQDGSFLSVIKAQLEESLPANATPENTVIAYEPVWAIGTGKVPVQEEIAEVHQFITESLAHRFRILYGGSVKPANTEGIMAIPYVDGLLVGGCSLNADDFLHIIQSASIEN